MAKEVIEADLYGEWIHSREEDTESTIVYRPANYHFPLTRVPRNTFLFEPSGKLISGEPSPSDSITVKHASWKLENNKINIYSGSKLLNSESIESLDKDKLVLKKF